MKKHNKEFLTYIKSETGIDISPMLETYILNPNKLATANKETLKRVITEYAPIYKHFRWCLDGPNQIAFFNLALMCRTSQNIELSELLEDNQYINIETE